jgi:hypothetical protein
MSYDAEHGAQLVLTLSEYLDCAVRTALDVNAYVEGLEKHLRLTLFTGEVAGPEGAVLLVRGALAGGDRSRAAELAEATQRLAAVKSGDQDMAAAAGHARGLVEQNPAALDHAPRRYGAARSRDGALEDAGGAWAARADRENAAARLRGSSCPLRAGRRRRRDGQGARVPARHRDPAAVPEHSRRHFPLAARPTCGTSSGRSGSHRGCTSHGRWRNGPGPRPGAIRIRASAAVPRFGPAG